MTTCCRRSRPTRIYGGGYPLFTALGRPLIAKLAVEYARKAGCDTIAHGCTGKGNDQVRIESTVIALDPAMKIIAPVRGWQMGREEEIAYAREHGIAVKGGTETPPYSIDDNLWGRSSEGGPIEDLEEPPRDDVFQLVTRPELAPDEPEDVTVGFERGVPVSLNGERLGLVELLERAGEIGARHGVGIVDHIEDRIVGLKVRDLYEVPAAAIILPAHKELEKLVGTIHQNTFKPRLDEHWAYLVYAGLWYEPLLSDLNALHGRGERAGDRGDHDAAVQGQRAAGGAPLAERALRPGAGRLRRVGRAVLAAGQPRVHRALVAAVADGVQRAQPGYRRRNEDQGLHHARLRSPGRGIKLILRRKLGQNRVKLGAGGNRAAGADRRAGDREGDDGDGGTRASPIATIVFFPEGAYGPTNNCVGIGDVLRRRGHRVVFIVEESFAGALEEKGFEERLMRLTPPAEDEEDPGQFWKDFIRETAPVFRKPTIEQLGDFIAPTFQALVDGAKYVDERLVEIIDEVQPDVIVEDNVVSFPALPACGRPWVRIVSCNPAELKDPEVPPTFSGYPTADRPRWAAYWDEYRARPRRPARRLRRLLPRARRAAAARARVRPQLALAQPLDLSRRGRLPARPRRSRHAGTTSRRASAPRTRPGSRRARPTSPLVYLSLGSLASGDVELMRGLIALPGRLAATA